MLLTRFEPMREFRELEERLESALKVPELRSEFSSFKPSVNTREGEYAYHVEVDLPGVKKDDISVDIKDNVLTMTSDLISKVENHPNIDVYLGTEIGDISGHIDQKNTADPVFNKILL